MTHALLRATLRQVKTSCWLALAALGVFSGCAGKALDTYEGTPVRGAQQPPDAGRQTPDASATPDSGYVIPDASYVVPDAGKLPDSGAVIPDSGYVVPDSSILPDSGPPIPEGGLCMRDIDDAGLQPYESVVSGGFDGPLRGVICSAGATSYLELAPGSQSSSKAFLFSIDTNFQVPAAEAIQVDVPSNATSAGIGALINLGGSQVLPGVYDDLNACGSVVVSVTLPTEVECDGGSPPNCPPGCQPFGPEFALVCAPAAPELTYSAQTGSDCVSTPRPAFGTWTLTLTSVDLVEPASTTYGISYYAVHGTLDAQLVSDQSDAGLAPVSLAVTF